MAFPWRVIAEAPLASGHLVEDLQLGLALAASGSAPGFFPRALVTSVFPTDAEAARTQRTRWEHGHLALIASQVPRLLWQSLASGRPALAAMALDAAVPPLASLLLLQLAATTAAALLAAAGGSWLALALSLASLIIVFVSVLIAWQLQGRSAVSARDLFAIPGYVLGKLPIYWTAMRKRQHDWIRTKR